MSIDQKVDTISLNYFFTKIKAIFATITEYNQKVANICPYPVGAIYFSVNSANPSTYFGGEWEAWGAGCVPVCIDTNDTDFDTVEETGGAKTHTLTVAELAPHTHTYSSIARTTSPRGASGNRAINNIASLPTADSSATGGDQPHNNLQPYITCYMWKRVQ